MKKLYFFLCLLMTGNFAIAQSIPGADMETWRTNHAGSGHPVTVQAPYAWYGADSLIIAYGQTFGLFIGRPDSVWKRQLFREDTVVHGGAHAAKVMTRDQDTAGMFPGILSNSKANVPFSLSGIGTITYYGGTGVSQRITSVSAWVMYLPGIDTATHAMGGADTAVLTVQALGTLMGKDTIVGIGVVKIPPSSSYTMITANINYFDTTRWVDTVRITFTSSGGARGTALDSSTLYVDDVTMVGVAQDTLIPDTTSHVGVKNIATHPVMVYPNPVNGTIFLEAPLNEVFHFELMSVSGITVATQKVSGNSKIDVSALPAGMYFYMLKDYKGNTIQRDKLTLQ